MGRGKLEFFLLQKKKKKKIEIGKSWEEGKLRKVIEAIAYVFGARSHVPISARERIDRFNLFSYVFVSSNLGYHPIFRNKCPTANASPEIVIVKSLEQRKETFVETFVRAKLMIPAELPSSGKLMTKTFCMQRYELMIYIYIQWQEKSWEISVRASLSETRKSARKACTNAKERDFPEINRRNRIFPQTRVNSEKDSGTYQHMYITLRMLCPRKYSWNSSRKALSTDFRKGTHTCPFSWWKSSSHVRVYVLECQKMWTTTNARFKKKIRRIGKEKMRLVLMDEKNRKMKTPDVRVSVGEGKCPAKCSAVFFLFVEYLSLAMVATLIISMVSDFEVALFAQFPTSRYFPTYLLCAHIFRFSDILPPVVASPFTNSSQYTHGSLEQFFHLTAFSILIGWLQYIPDYFVIHLWNFIHKQYCTISII